MTHNYFKMNILSYTKNQAFIRDAVAAFCLELNPTLSDLSDVKTAVSEAVTNCSVHAYRHGVGTITIECMIDHDMLHIKVSDFGCGINDVEKAMQPFFTTCQTEERSGMGFTIMQTFMDEFSVESIVGEGTIVRMAKRFTAEVKDAVS